MLWILFMLSFGSGCIDVVLQGVADFIPTRAATEFNYDAVESRGRRKSPPISSQSEDLILNIGKREKLIANARDLARNFSIAMWAIRRHLDYVATFDFHAQTEDKEFNNYWEAQVEIWSQPENFSRTGRHRLSKSLRLAEARRVIDGDIGWLKLTDGRIQVLEGDRIRQPLDASEDWYHGVQTDVAGKALKYSLYRRTKSGYEFERIVPAANFWLHGYYEREDQTRGVSPLASALNPLRDVYENFDYALAKSKITQLFALAIFRQAAESAGVIDEVSGETDAPRERKKYQVDFGKGPVQLDLEPGDDAKFLESNQPSTQFKDFTLTMILVGLKALDIPFSFFDESHTNFFGSRGAWLHYERACLDKRGDNAELLSKWVMWRSLIAWLDGEFTLPRGMEIDTLAHLWVPRGMPWWKPSEEINGDVQAVSAGLDNPENICRRRGTGDVYDNIDATARVQKYAREKGVELSFAPTATAIQVIPADEVQNAN